MRAISIRIRIHSAFKSDFNWFEKFLVAISALDHRFLLRFPEYWNDFFVFPTIDYLYYQVFSNVSMDRNRHASFSMLDSFPLGPLTIDHDLREESVSNIKVSAGLQCIAMIKIKINY